MTVGELKARILANTLVDQIRINLRVDEEQREQLYQLLRDLAAELREHDSIDKELALTLYSMPQMVRNVYLSFANDPKPLPAVAQRLEDIWVELDELVIECLRQRTGCDS